MVKIRKIIFFILIFFAIHSSVGAYTGTNTFNNVLGNSFVRSVQYTKNTGYWVSMRHLGSGYCALVGDPYGYNYQANCTKLSIQKANGDVLYDELIYVSSSLAGSGLEDYSYLEYTLLSNRYIINNAPATVINQPTYPNALVVSSSGGIIYDLATETYIPIAGSIHPTQNCKPIIKNNNYYELCKVSGVVHNYILGITTGVYTEDTSFTLSTTAFDTIPDRQPGININSLASGTLYSDATDGSVKFYNIDSISGLLTLYSVFTSATAEFIGKFYYHSADGNYAYSYDAQEGSNTGTLVEAYIYNTTTGLWLNKGNYNFVYYDGVNNNYIGLAQDFFSNISKPEQFIFNYTANSIYYLANDNTSIYYYNSTGGSGALEFPGTGGGGGGTGTGSIGSYDDSIWDWDFNNDGEIGIFNGELWRGIAGVFKYFFGKIIAFFSSLTDFLDNLGGFFTSEVKTFSFFPVTYATSLTDLTDNMTTAQESEGYNNSPIGQVASYVKYGFIFLLIFISFVIFLNLNKKNKG